MTPQETATLALAEYQRQKALKALRLRQIERFRYRQWYESLDLEPGRVPYGASQPQSC